VSRVAREHGVRRAARELGAREVVEALAQLEEGLEQLGPRAAAARLVRRLAQPLVELVEVDLARLW